MRLTIFWFRGWPTTPPSKSVCWEFKPHCAQSGGLLGATSCAPALTDKKASNPARRHALARTFRFDRTKFILYHLVLKYLQLGQVLVNGSSRLPYTYCKMKCARLSGAGVFKCSSRSATCLVQQPGASIQAVKKPGRRLLFRTQETLEGHNLFGIRKF